MYFFTVGIYCFVFMDAHKDIHQGFSILYGLWAFYISYHYHKFSSDILYFNAHAYEVKNVCASTQSGFQWTRSQPIQIQIIGGMELQQASGFNPNIKGWVSYAFIDWTNGRSTVIELTSPYVAGMMMFQTEGVDSTGRKWRFSDNMGYCV